MSEEKKQPGFEIVDGKAVGRLVKGITIAGALHKDFVMQEFDVGMLMSAEQEISSANFLSFNAHLMLQQLVSIGTYTGPFSINMMKPVKGPDWRILRAAQIALEALGEPEPADLLQEAAAS